MDSKLYPQGRTASYSKYVQGVLKFFRRSDQSEIFSLDGVNAQLDIPGVPRTIRTRVIAADIDAGATLVAAVPGYTHQMIDCTMIAYGGNAAGSTTVDILGTQSTSSVKLVANAVAALTQSARVSAGEAPAAGTSAILADGASFAPCDENTAITIGKTGGAFITATGVDVILTYSTVAA